jgi:kynureninase
MRVGTPPVIQLTALEVAMDLWADVDMAELRAASIALQEQFIEEVERDVPALTLASPRDSAVRGSQVSFRFHEGYAAMQAVIDRGVIGDFRAPDIMRFGFTPMYLDSADITAAVKIIADVMNNDLWDQDKYKVRSKVT